MSRQHSLECTDLYPIAICIFIFCLLFGCNTHVRQIENTPEDIRRIELETQRAIEEYRKHEGSGEVPLEKLDDVLEFNKYKNLEKPAPYTDLNTILEIK